MRILYFADGPWGTRSLQRLVAESHHILGVVVRTRPTDPALLDLAEQLSLPLFQPEKVNAPEFLAVIARLNPHLNVSVSYDQILRKQILTTAPLGFINFHAGMLPYYRGRNVINWAIINGETEIGLTAHHVNEGIDTGDIILQRRLPVAWTDTYADVLQTLLDAFPGVVSEAVSLLDKGQAPRLKQDHLPGSYFAMRREGDEWLDWSDTSRNVYNKIRAITRPGPGGRTVLQDQPLQVWRAQYDPIWPVYRANPGEVVGRRAGQGVLVKTGDSVILLQEVQQPATGPFVPNWPIGTRLGVNLSAALSRLETQVAALQRQVEELRSPARNVA